MVLTAGTRARLQLGERRAKFRGSFEGGKLVPLGAGTRPAQRIERHYKLQIQNYKIDLTTEQEASGPENICRDLSDTWPPAVLLVGDLAALRRTKKHHPLVPNSFAVSF